MDPVLLLRRSSDELEFVLTARGYHHRTMVIRSASWAGLEEEALTE
jgi:hypothetical protein